MSNLIDNRPLFAATLGAGSIGAKQPFAQYRATYPINIKGFSLNLNFQQFNITAEMLIETGIQFPILVIKRGQSQ